MKNNEIVERLKAKGVHATANRLLVYDAFTGLHNPVSLSALETLLPTMDKSSIFRAVRLFLKHDVLHAIDDGTKQVKYEICPSQNECDATQRHIHFYCERCGQTFCLDDISIPTVELPESYAAHSINYIVKGTCPSCRSKALQK
ncbi:MAG: transcriptional repressor [Bacteroidales bacterium]|nr:transcriptional repressor [Bacteroidales bacterium]